MIIACVVSGMIGALFGVCVMACFIVGAAEDKFIEYESKKGQ